MRIKKKLKTPPTYGIIVGMEEFKMQFYLFPALLALTAITLGVVNIFYPPLLSVIVVLVGILAAYAIIKINEG